jgi:lysophospholipase
MRIALASLILLLTATNAEAIKEEQLEQAWSTTLRPFIHRGNALSFEGAGGVVLKGRHFPHPKARASLIFLSGFSEPWIKYGELLHDLHQEGFEIYTYDHRGQGASPRGSQSHAGAVHIRRFEDYVEDLERFISIQTRSSTRKKWNILAHSMGGAIALAYLEKHPETRIRRFALNAPMLAMKTDPLPRSWALGLASLLTRWGAGEHFAPTKGPFEPDRPFASNPVTSSEIRYKLEQRMVREFPGVWVGGPTNAWVAEAIRASAGIARIRERIQRPLLMLLPSDDRFAQVDELSGLCGKLEPLCRAVRFEGAKHEIFVEGDRFRNPALTTVLEFLEAP